MSRIERTPVGTEGKEGKAGPEGKEGKTGPEGPPGPSTGPAGGDLEGTYPNPTLAASTVTDTEVAAGAAIAESKLNLPNVVFLGENQTITGIKSFAPTPTPEAEVETGAAGVNGLVVTPSHGQDTSETEGTSRGGIGGGNSLTAARGGYSLHNPVHAIGGVGGIGSLTGGPGGIAGMTNAAIVVGGEGGAINAFGGSGGAAVGSGTGTRTGGHGGPASVAGGLGGEAVEGTGTRVGGEGGETTIRAGGGGEGSTKGGKGGGAIVEAGAAGVGGTPAGGPVEILGGTASTNALSGKIIFKTGKAKTERLVVTGTGVIEAKGEIKGEAATFSKKLIVEAEGLEVVKGLATVKEGLTVEGALTLPASSVTEAMLDKATKGSKALAFFAGC